MRTHTSVKSIKVMKLANLFRITCKLCLCSDKTFSGRKKILNANKKKKVIEETWVNSAAVAVAQKIQEEICCIATVVVFFLFFFARQFFFKSSSAGGNIYCVWAHTCCCKSVSLFCFSSGALSIILVRFSRLHSPEKINRVQIFSIFNQSLGRFKNKPSESLNKPSG